MPGASELPGWQLVDHPLIQSDPETGVLTFQGNQVEQVRAFATTDDIEKFKRIGGVVVPPTVVDLNGYDTPEDVDRPPVFILAGVELPKKKSYVPIPFIPKKLVEAAKARQGDTEGGLKN